MHPMCQKNIFLLNIYLYCIICMSSFQFMLSNLKNMNNPNISDACDVMYQTFVTPAVKLNEKKLAFVIQIFWRVHRDTEWLIHRSRWLYKHQHKHRHSQQRRLSTELLFSVYLSIQKQQSSPSEHTHVCVCIHPHFFVYNTTGALEAVFKHDQMNTEALISQQRENMFALFAART